MSEEYRFKDRIKDIINGDVDYDKLRKAEKQGCYNLAHGAGTGRCGTSDYLFLHQEKCGGRDGSEKVE